MGLRYRKRIKILPGIYINISKSGISTNVGVKGASVTLDPKGTYVNTGLPGTGLYRRDRIYGSNKKHELAHETDDERYAFSNNLQSIEEYSEETSFLSYNPLHYIFYLFSLIFPIAAFVWYINGLDMLYSCLINAGFQLTLCFAIITNMSLKEENSAYRIKLIEEASVNSIKGEIVGHVIRCYLYLVIIILNLFPLLSMSGSFVSIFCGYEKSWNGGVLVFLLTLLIVTYWIKAFIKEKKFIISLDNAILLKQGINRNKLDISSCPNDNIEGQITKSEPNTFSNEEYLTSPNLDYPLSKVNTPEAERINESISSQEGHASSYKLPDSHYDGGKYNPNNVDMTHLDPLFEDAARMIVKEQSGSCGLIMRKFAIGYNRAVQLMTQLEKAGIVGTSHGSKIRDVLITNDRSLEYLLSQWRQ